MIKNITKSFGKEVAKSTARQTFTKTIFKSFVGEAFEEGLSEMLTPVWKRLTYDPNAKNATFQEIGYAALVGGLSGAIMGGFDVSVRNVGSYTRGNTIVNQSKADGVLSTAQQISEYETNNHTGYESFEAVQSLYNELQSSLTKTNGQISTMRQKMLVGMLERANTSATFTPFVARSAENIVNNAELIAQRLSSYGYTDANGNPITFTAEQIRNGVDVNKRGSFANALKNNDILRTLAVADATGQLTMDTAKFREATLMGQRLSSQADLNRFIETATDSELRAVSERLGIEDWQTITNEEFQNKITEFVENGGVETYRQESLIIKEAQSISLESAQRLGRVVRLTQDGTYRFRSANADIAIVKNGDSYRIFDYESGRLSNELTRAELNRVIREINNQNEQAASAVKEQLEQREQQENRYKIQAQEIDTFARENIKDYAKLNESNKSMVRAVIRQARASGIAEADVLSYARVSAHTGLNIIFSKRLCKVGTDSNGDLYADGYFDTNNNRIVVNPETKRTHEQLLIHELTHVIYRTQDGKLILERGVRNMSDAEKQSIIKRYSEAGRGKAIELMDEINAHYAEGMLTNKNLIEKLVADKPTIKDRIVNFFKRSTETYSEDTKLTKAAKSLFSRYKKLFDSFSAVNQQSNSVEVNNSASNRMALANDGENGYNNQKGVKNGEENAETTENQQTSRQTNVRDNRERRSLSVFNDNGTVRQLSEIIKDKPKEERIGNLFTEIYTKSVNETQDNLIWHAKNEDVKIYFAKSRGSGNVYYFDGENLIVNENITEKNLVDILNIEKPIQRNVDTNKVAHISNERWNRFIDFEPKTYLTRIPIQQFLDMTTENYVEQRQLNARSTQMSKKIAASDIKNTAGEFMYLKIDLKNNKVVDHEGRHRMTALLNAGNAYADVFVIPVNDVGADYYGNIEVTGQFNSNKYNLGLVRAQSKKFADSIERVFRIDDGNIRYALPETDSNGNALTDKQREYFSNSKVVDENGNLLVVYHGTGNNEFTIFDIKKSKATGMLGQGFYFTKNQEEASSKYAKRNGRVISAYLNLEKPLYVDLVHKSSIINKLRDEFGGKFDVDAYLYNARYRDRVDTSRMLSLIQQQGYDGIINKQKGYYVAFNSNQIKETTNIRPTLNNDIRYALDNSKDAKDLVAIHNTSEAKLLQSIELGGLAMPSIAIVRSDIGHEGFGNISLILKSDAIDPQKNYDNKVYSADAYSPRFPQIAYSFNGKELRALADKMDTSVSMLEANDFAEGNTRERMIDNLKNNEYFIKHYLKEFGIKAEIVYKPAEYSNAIYLKEDVKNFLLKDYSFEELMNSDKVQQELQNAVDKAKEKETREFKKNILQHSYEKLIRSLDDARNEKFIYDILEKDYNNDKLIAQGKAEQVVNAYETERKTKEKLNGDKQFNDYAKSSVDKVLDKKYLRNNKDYYTNSGNPRSFEALHDDYTAENAVRIMKEQGGKNSEGGNVFGFGIGEIRAALSKIYYSIEEMHQDEYRLQTITDESSKLYEECNDDLHNIASGLSERIKTGNFLEEHDIALNAIFDVISKTKTNEQAKRLIKRDYRLDITDTEITDIRKLADKVAELPVKYFEAKPERVVNFNEIVKAFVPINTNKRILDFLREQGIDVQIYSESTPTRAELIKTLSDDIRFALQTNENEDSRAIGGLSRGQRAKFVANNTHLKVYSKAEAAEVINSIIDERLVLEDKYGSLSGKSKAEVVDMLFRQLNSAKEGYRSSVALNIADYLIENTVLNDMYVYDNADAMNDLTVLRSYMHKVDLKSIWGEIQYKFDDKRNSIALVWGAREGGMAPDVIAQELNDRGIRIEAINEADCFFEMLEKYESLRKDVNQKAKEVMLRDYGSEEQIETLRQQIAKDILLAYDQKGTQSKYGRLVEKYTAQIESLRRQVKETRQQNILMNNIADRAQKLKDLKLGTFLNATQYKNDIFQNSIERLANIKYRGNFNATGTRRIMAELRQWYNKDNPVLADSYSEDVAYMIDTLSQGNRNYTTEELSMLRNVMSYFVNFVENYNKVYRQGKWIDAIPEAERYIDVLHRNKDVKLGIFNRLTSSTYYQTFGDPMAVARRMDMYENGFYTEMMSELRDAAVDAEIAEMEVKTPYKNFLDTHKKYLREIENTLVTYQGVEIPKTHLISLYMTLKREQAQAGLAQNGFAFIDNKKNKVRVKGFAPDVASDTDLLTRVVEEQAKIDKLLSNTDREYIAILESGYNQDAKKLKAERDMQRLGFTNATEDYYYPIRRGNIARNIDTSDIASELDRVSNASFNKDTVRGAKQELYIESADVVYNRHIKAVTKYAYLSPAIENYNRLYNVDISGNRNKPVSVATESANTWDKGNKYFSKLISDIQGIPSSSSEGMKLLGFIRGSYAKFQLGANPKTWVTQLSSLFASTSILDTNSVIRGLTISGKDVDTYCSLAKLRNADNTAAMAQGLLDKVGKVSNVLMAPIGKMDRFVIRKLFGACQVQVEKNGGAKVGTVANKTEAGKLLRRVILETQQNSIVTERSAAMRSGNEVLRTVTMFSADSMKAMARLVDSVGELTTLRAKLRATTDVELQNTLRKQIKTAQRKLRKSAMAMASTAAFMVGVAQLFNWLYNKDNDDEEDKAQALVVDFVGNLFGGLPLIRDIYTKFTEGYDIDSYSYSALNDLLNSAVDIFDLVENLVSGNSSSQEIASSIKKLSYAIGQAFGFPVRNIYNVLYGLTKRISPATAYKIDNTFYNKSYISDLNAAIENDDAEMITTIMSILLNERIGGEISDKVIERLNRLYSLGYSVLPRTVGTSLTYNGESFAITSAQRESFKKIYSQANKYIESMITDRSFGKLTEEQQAKALKQVYDAYYSKALSDTLNVDAETNLYKYSQFIPINKLSIALTGISGIESDKTLQGTTISGSKKKKVITYLLGQNLTDEQRLLILLLQGYTIQDREYKNYTEEQVKNKLLKYILAMKITQSEKEDLLSKIGYEVKNGRVIINR
ncbi:MAG TPA: carboxylesterase family protein [Candidatus Onthoplasma faecipullorum]|nr:carboxylesterase family protein [Candidatus Onthoplasma faecipullorum]